MKRVVIVIFVGINSLGVFADGARAETGLEQGAMALTVDTDVGRRIDGRYFVSDETALVGGVELLVSDNDEEGVDYGLSAGVRRYLDRRDFAPFVEGKVSYRVTNDSDDRSAAVLAGLGAEYFFDKRFSVEGAAMLFLAYEESGDFENTGFGTLASGLKLNYYF